MEKLEEVQGQGRDRDAALATALARAQELVQEVERLRAAAQEQQVQCADSSGAGAEVAQLREQLQEREDVIRQATRGAEERAKDLDEELERQRMVAAERCKAVGAAEERATHLE